MSANWLLNLSRPTDVPWPAAILDIARETESRNPALGLTGMLLYSRTFYLRYLEGPARAVESVAAHLAEDRRHETVWTVTGTAPASRLSGLTMGYFDADRETSAALTGALWRRHQGWRRDDAEALIAMLVEIAREKYPSALSGEPPGSA
jgi:hypothetical protein